MNNNNGGSNIILSSISHGKATKKNKKPKKKPIKVVYISNPMKVQTSASKFRDLVQQLTGQDAEFPDPSKFPVLTDTETDTDIDNIRQKHDQKVEMSVAGVAAAEEEFTAVGDDSDNGVYDEFDELFYPPMIENFSGLLQSAVLYQSYAS